MIYTDLGKNLPNSDELPCSDDTAVDNEDQNFLPNYLLFLLELIWKARNDWCFGAELPSQDKGLKMPSTARLLIPALFTLLGFSPLPALAQASRLQHETAFEWGDNHLYNEALIAQTLVQANPTAIRQMEVAQLRKQVTETEPLLRVEGVLEPGDPLLDNGGLYDEYSFEGQAGQTISITLESLAFDTYLILQDPTGQTLAENDDIEPDNQNSWLTVALPVDGIYQVLVNAYEEQAQGDYKLTILLGESGPVLSEGALRQVEANQLLEQGFQQYQVSQFREALRSWQAALEIYREIGDRFGEGFTLNNIGNVYQSQGDYPQALECYQQFLAINRDIGDRSDEAIILSNIAGVYQRQGDYPQALDYFQQSLAITRDIGDLSDEALVLNNIGGVYQSQGDYPQALDYFQQSLAITRQIGDRASEGGTLNEGAILNNIGLVYQRQGDYPQALDYYQQSLVITRQIGNRAGEGLILNNIGLVYQSQGDYPQALDSYQQSLAITRQIGDRASEGLTLNNIGLVYQSQGDYSQALDSYQQSLAITRQIGDRAGEGLILNSIGLIYQSLGDYPQALDTYQQSLAITREIGDRASEGLTLNNIGFVYLSLEDYLQALDYLQQALAIIREIGDRASEGLILNGIGIVHLALEDYLQGLDYFQQALAISREVGNRYYEGSALSYIGEAYQNLEDYPQALDYFQQTLAIARDIGSRDMEAFTLGDLGSLFETQDQPELAIVFFKQSVNVFETLRDNIRTLEQELQQSYITKVEEIYRDLADLLLQQDRVLEAQRVLDLLRVQEIDDYLRGVRGNENTTNGIVVLRPEQAILERYGELQQSAIEVGRELEELRETPETERTAAEQQRIDTLVDLQGGINRQFREFAALPEVRDWVDELTQNLSPMVGDPTLNLAWLSKLRDDLKTLNAAILYPLILEDRLELVITVPNSPPLRRTVNVSRVEMNRVIAEFRSKLGRSDTNPYGEAGQLYDWLIRPLEDDLEQAGVDTLIYSPDGQLRYVSLAALWDRDTEQWLVQRYRINNITADSLTDFDKQPHQQPRLLAGAFADPSLRYSIPIEGKDTIFTGLPFAGQEVENLTSILPGLTSFFDSDFSLRAIKGRIEEYDILHFATHAAFLPSIPEQSFILFGNGDRPNVLDIADWPLYDMDLVVLSACETGIGGLGNGSEIIGMGYQFQVSGARAVIASLWAVDDGGTQSLMNAFYQSLSLGNVPKAEALRQAQIALIERQGHLLGNPRGGFEIISKEGESLPQTLDRLSHPY